jgi:hypothetical protein
MGAIETREGTLVAYESAWTVRYTPKQHPLGRSEMFKARKLKKAALEAAREHDRRITTEMYASLSYQSMLDANADRQAQRQIRAEKIDACPNCNPIYSRFR